jgi:hypothetical protein
MPGLKTRKKYKCAAYNNLAAVASTSEYSPILKKYFAVLKILFLKAD